MIHIAKKVVLLRPILRVSLVFFLLLSLSLTFASSAAAFDPGDLDATFGIGGKVITDFFGNDVIQSLVIQSDGKIVVGGGSYSSPETGDFALARYNTDGSLDATFGIGGKVTTSFGSGVATVWSLAIYNSGPDAGKILAAGDTTAFGPNDFALARYNADGTLDTAFGAGGKVTTNIAGGSSDQVFAVALQSDHKIVVAGTSNPNAGGSWDFALARYNADGTLDTTNFGAGGKVLTDFGGGVDDGFRQFTAPLRSSRSTKTREHKTWGGREDHGVEREKKGEESSTVKSAQDQWTR